MEHPDVIREIDALIDSYHWGQSLRDPDKAVRWIKESLRNGGKINYLWLETQQSRLIMFQICAEVLQHPRVRHKAWILETLSDVAAHSRIDPRDTFAIQKSRALKRAIPLLRHYMKHHKALYRRYAAATLSCLIYQPDQVVRWLTEHLQHENSFEVVFEIFERLKRLLLARDGQLISPETRSSVIDHLDNRLRSKSPVMKIAAATLLLGIMQFKTPSYVINTLVENWSFLDTRHKSHWRVLENLMKWLRRRDGSKRQDVSMALLRHSTDFVVAMKLWEEIQHHYFQRFQATRRIAFSSTETQFLEALLACKPLWRIRRASAPEWERRYTPAYWFQPWLQGLETNHAALRQQLRHACIVNLAFDDLWQFPDLPLRLDSNVQREIDHR